MSLSWLSLACEVAEVAGQSHQLCITTASRCRSFPTSHKHYLATRTTWKRSLLLGSLLVFFPSHWLRSKAPVNRSSNLSGWLDFV